MRAAREGASVICVDRDEEAAQATWRQIVEEGGQAAVLICDVTTEEGCRTAVPEEKGLAPDGIVLNVGVGYASWRAPPRRNGTAPSSSTCGPISCSCGGHW